MSFYNKLKNLIARSPVAESLDGTEKLLVLVDPDGEGIMKSATVQQIADLGGGGGGEAEYLEYVAKLRSSGTNDPTATEFINTLGGTPTLTRFDTGRYYMTLEGAFPDESLIYGLGAMCVGYGMQYLFFVNVLWDDEASPPGSRLIIESTRYDTQLQAAISADDILTQFNLHLRILPSA